MLVLSRKSQESVIINSDIVVTVLEVDKKTGAVRLGIDAPRSYRVLREEVFRQIEAENMKAVASQSALELLSHLQIGPPKINKEKNAQQHNELPDE